MIYIVKQKVVVSKAAACVGVDCDCPLRGMGYQFFYLLIFDMTVGNLGLAALTYLKWKVRHIHNKWFATEKEEISAFKVCQFTLSCAVCGELKLTRLIVGVLCCVVRAGAI